MLSVDGRGKLATRFKGLLHSGWYHLVLQADIHFALAHAVVIKYKWCARPVITIGAVVVAVTGVIVTWSCRILQGCFKSG